jgi:hypothetical protein
MLFIPNAYVLALLAAQSAHARYRETADQLLTPGIVRGHTAVCPRTGAYGRMPRDTKRKGTSRNPP